MLVIMCISKHHTPVLLTNWTLVGLSTESDNKTTKAYLRNGGGTKWDALMNLCRKIFRILYYSQVHYHYIAGRYNSEADHLPSTPSIWRPDLRNRAISLTYIIRNLDKVLMNVMTTFPPPRWQEMTLVVCICGLVR